MIFDIFSIHKNHDRDKCCEMKSLENWILKLCMNWAATVEILFVDDSQKSERNMMNPQVRLPGGDEKTLFCLSGGSNSFLYVT